MAKILLVEDEINIASFIERGLKEFGHSVTVCHDGDTGWKILQDKPFDLLILDIIMPKINGLELCRLYRQMFGYQIPVIMLTALGTTEDIVKGLDAGADDYLVKPFSFQEQYAANRTGKEFLKATVAQLDRPAKIRLNVFSQHKAQYETGAWNLELRH